MIGGYVPEIPLHRGKTVTAPHGLSVFLLCDKRFNVLP